jgi:hypothetical protein
MLARRTATPRNSVDSAARKMTIRAKSNALYEQLYVHPDRKSFAASALSHPSVYGRAVPPDDSRGHFARR